MTQDAAQSLDLAFPALPTQRMGLFEFIRRLRENSVSIYPRSSFAEPFGFRTVLFQSFVLLNDPEMIQHVLLTNQKNYPKGRLNRQLLGRVLGTGLLTSEGEFWRRQRRIAAPAFHHRRLVALTEIMVEAIAAKSLEWRERAGDEVDMLHEMMQLTMDIVTRTLFSSDVADDAAELGAAVTRLLDGFGSPSLVDLIGLPEWMPRSRDREAEAAIRYVEDRLYRIIAERRAGGTPREDLLQMLLDSKDEETGEGMSDEQLRDELFTLFAAGHETTANALTWTWYLLALHPEAEARLHAERDAALRDGAPAFGDLENLPYSRMVFEESMRLYPPAFSTSRVALEEDRIGEHVIPKGAIVTLSPWVTHRNPHLWPDPERFDPERFAPGKQRERHKFAYFPFGGGPRVCIGNAFALMEGRLALAMLSEHVRPRLRPGQKVEPLGRITLRPKGGLPMILEPR